jgi:hypothetical protein
MVRALLQLLSLLFPFENFLHLGLLLLLGLGHCFILL